MVSGLLRTWSVGLAVGLGLAGCTGGGGGPAAGPSGPAEPVLPATEAAALPALDDIAWQTLAGPGIRLDPTEAYLTGPAYSVALDRVAVAATLHTEEASVARALLATSSLTPVPTIPMLGQLALHAAAGHEFVVARLASDPPKPVGGDDSGSRPGVSAFVRIGRGPRVPLQQLDDGMTLVVSVPVGATPYLAIDDGSHHPQSIDLRSGRPGPDAVTLFHPVRQQTLSAGPNALFTGPGCVSLFASSLDVRLSPWISRSGWAPAGRAWLVATLRALASPGVVTLDARRSVTVTGADGAFHRPVPAQRPVQIDHAGSTLPTSVDHDIVFAVPASFRSGTMRWTLAATCAVTAGGPTVPASPSRQQNLTQGIALPR